MRIYLDLCCLKRPFDSQEQTLVRLETEAVLAVLAAPAEQAELLRSGAHALENSFNPRLERRQAVDAWWAERPNETIDEAALRQRTDELIQAGLPGFDALHVASAELMAADVFLTVDQPLVRRAARLGDLLRVRVIEPVAFLQEVREWST